MDNISLKCLLYTRLGLMNVIVGDQWMYYRHHYLRANIKGRLNNFLVLTTFILFVGLLDLIE